MSTIETEAVVLRTLRYGEADAILALLTPGMGRVSAIAKGARSARSKQGGRLQPGVRLHASLARGRGDLMGLRSTQVVDAGAGLWMDGYRLRAAGCVLEAALRVVPEHEEAEAAFNLVTRALSLIAHAPPRDSPPRLDPHVLGTQAKLLATSGLVPHLASCAACGGPPPLSGFSASAGCVLEAALRVVPEHEEAEAAFNLVTRALSLIAHAPPREGPPRLDPFVLGTQAKLLATSGLVPHLASCAACGGPPPLSGFSASAGGGVCDGCLVGSGAERLDPAAADALVALLARPLAEAPGCVDAAAAPGAERLIALMLREHLGVTLRSGTPL